MSNKYYIVPIFVPHIGCPHDCVFCNQKKITGRDDHVDYDYVINRAEEVLSTIDKKNSFVEISFFGGSFTGIPFDYQKELLSAAKKLVDDGKIDSIRLSTRPDYINDTILNNLKAFGVKTIELGIQSMDDEVLRAAERGHTVEDVYRAVELIKEFDFELGLQMMIGLPKDNEEKDIKTANEIVNLKPNFVRIYPALVIKDTEMEKMFKEGLYIPLSLQDAVNITKKVYLIFIKNDINIIRVGLQASEGIALGRDVVAGPFHPAFRELVEGSIICDMIRYIFNEYFKEYKEIRIFINNKTISKLYTNRKYYFNLLVNEYKDKSIRVFIDDNLSSLEVVIEADTLSRKMSIKDFAKFANLRRI